MCGRFTLTTADYESVARAFEAELDGFDVEPYRPRYNVAPTDAHPLVVRTEAGKRLRWGKWGLVPPWGRGKPKPPILINVRSEQLGTHRGFKPTLLQHRCIVPADGFFEWTGPKHDRLPLWFHRPDGGPIGFAGMFGDVVDPVTNQTKRTFTILTTEPNALVAPVHDRMPVVLEPADYDLWLAPAPASDREDFLGSLLELLRPFPTDGLVAAPVSNRANDVRNDDPGCLEPRDQPGG